MEITCLIKTVIMRNFYLLCCFLIMRMSTAIAGHASIYLDLSTPAAYRISFQGNYYTFNGNSFNFDEFDAGAQQIAIERFNGNNYVAVYNGIMRFEDNFRVYAKLDAFGRLNVYQKEPLQVIAPPVVMYPPQEIAPHCGTPPPTCPTVQLPPPFAKDADYQALLQRLESAWYDDDRKLIAFNAFRYQNFSADQVKGILKNFWYEDYKLEVAKEAFKYSTDKANFFKINDVFWYSASIQELNMYMLEFRG